MYYVGLMSGTSADAIDAALVSIGAAQLRLVDYRQYPLDPVLQAGLLGTSPSTSIAAMGRLDSLLGEQFAGAALELLKRNALPPAQVRAIGSHGQTVLHSPEAAPPCTLQVGNPNRIAALTGITTVADFRRADMAAGGQGAPLAPAFHAWRFHRNGVNRVVLNVGGIANITILPGDPDAAARGFDTGPGNTLMDAWTRQCRQCAYDEEGRWAASGEVQQDLLQRLLSDPYFSAPPPKSTGRDDFNLHWLAGYRNRAPVTTSDADVQATLLALTVHSIAAAISGHAPGTQEVLVCGGGVHNTTLMRTLQAALPEARLLATGDAGLDPDAVEAVSFAWLAQQRLDNVPANLPAVTGAKKPVVLGAIYAAG